jgi:hypothetical protein
VNDLAGLLPDAFCWTRFGTEAGESIERILDRKEAERRATGGTFYWGVGNSVASGIDELVRLRPTPEVLFSPIKGRPRAADVAPARVAVWRVGETSAGVRYPLPEGVRITSRFDDASRKTPRYALVCFQPDPLILSNSGRLRTEDLRNLVSGRPVGASQVTAVVRMLSTRSVDDRGYVVALRASLVPPYLIRLRDPALVENECSGPRTHPGRLGAEGQLALMDFVPGSR